MRNVVLGLRWVAPPTAAFFVFALITDVALAAATAAVIIVGVLVIAVSTIDLASRRRR